MDVSDWVTRQADFSPKKPAIIIDGHSISYAKLAAQIDSCAQVLTAGLSIQPGDRVAYLGLNSAELITLLFACSRIGAILLPMNWRLAGPERTQILQNAEPAVLFAEPEFIEHINEVRKQLPTLKLVNYGKASAGWTWYDELESYSQNTPPHPPPTTLSDTDGLLLCYTSGTTGAPKGALLSKNALFWNAVNSTHMHDLTSQDTVLTLLPMFHVGGLNIQTTPALHAGATVIMLKRFEVDLFYQALQEHPITTTLVVPTVMHAIMADPRWAKTQAPDLKLISIGSTVVPEKLVSAVCEWGTPMVQVYGSTETGPIAAYMPPADAARKPASTGKTAMHCEIGIVDKAGQPVATGDKGEILVRGPNVMTEYWRDSNATQSAFTDKWFHTGDVGHFDDEGFLTVDGRIKDMIICGGENIYPALIESVLSECPEIDEVAVVGRPDDYWGEICIAVIATKKGCSIDAQGIVDFCSDRIARSSIPREVIRVDQLPRNSMGKVVKEDLRKLVIQQSTPPES